MKITLSNSMDHLVSTMVSIKSLICFMAILIFSSGELLISQNFNEFEYGTVVNCTVLLESYANTSANFTYCAVKNARPIRICELCVDQYQRVDKAHKDILQVEDGSGNKKCKEQLMNLDRLEIIEGGFSNIQDLWARASCDACFESQNETLVLSNNTINFMEMQNVTQECFNEYKLGNGTYSKDVCKECETKYCDMNKFYDNLKNSQENICMDIVDSMNVTRMMWNDKLKCKGEAPKLDLILVVSSCLVGSLPIFFYVGAKLFSTVIRNRLQMQKRLAETLRPSTSREM